MVEMCRHSRYPEPTDDDKKLIADTLTHGTNGTRSAQARREPNGMLTSLAGREPKVNVENPEEAADNLDGKRQLLPATVRAAGQPGSYAGKAHCNFSLDVHSIQFMPYPRTLSLTLDVHSI